MTLVQALGIALTVSLSLYFFRGQLTHFFTDTDGGLNVTMALAVIPLFSFTNLVTMCLAFFMGCVRALGIQANVAMISIISFYIVSMPSACYFAFVQEVGILGLWIGYFLGIIIQTLVIA